MQYQVIARKWRPNAFKEVIGQDHVVRTLSNAITSGRIGHAFIFSGPRGVGKTTVARILARCLNCEQGPTAEPCLKCSNCTGVTSGSLVDVLEIDGASNNGVENVREICEAVRYAPASARYKIYIIDEVHMLSTAAFNALLKTLEEPPPHVVFIFATTEPQKIPLTIHSRCQRFDFRRIPLKQINSHLANIADKEGIEAEAAAIYMIAREADGSLRDAQSLLEQVISFSGDKLAEADVVDSLGLMDRGVIFDISGAMLGGDGAAVLNMVEKIHEFGYDFKKVTAELLEHIRDLVVIKVSGAGLLELPESELERLSALAKSVEIDRLQMIFSVFTAGYTEVARSTTPRFAFEMMLVRATLLEDLKGVGELIEKLERLSTGSKGRAGRGSGSGGIQRKQATPVQRVPLDASPKAPSDSSAKASLGDVREVARKTESVPLGTNNGSVGVAAPTTTEATGETAEESNGTKTVVGLLEFVKSTDMLIYNRLNASVLSVEGEFFTITAKAENINFLKLVKKEALLKICRDYFGSGIRLKFEKSNAPVDEQRQTSVGSEAAAPNKGTSVAEPPAYEEGEMVAASASPVGAALVSARSDEPSINNTLPKPTAAVVAEASPPAKGATTAPTKTEPVLKDTLFILEGKVIA
jgi:DNA polymerase-3 subunit gamma/tau